MEKENADCVIGLEGYMVKFKNCAVLGPGLVKAAILNRGGLNDYPFF